METGGGPFKPAQIRLHKELKISSCCDVGCPNRCCRGSSLKFKGIPDATARQKKQQQLCLNEKKRVDWTETIIRNARICSAHSY